MVRREAQDLRAESTGQAELAEAIKRYWQGPEAGALVDLLYQSALCCDGLGGS